MATVSLPLVRQGFPTGLQDSIYEVPNINTIAVVTNIVVVNTSDLSERFTILLDGIELFDDTPITGKATVSIDMKQVIQGSIEALASSNLVKVHISGVEIS